MTCHIICGPTACGKSDFASSIENANIINGDSLQLYSDLSVLTARPKDDQSHQFLYGFLKPYEQINVMQWMRMVEQCIKTSYESDRIPVIVGGTGFYLSVLLNGISYIPEIPKNISTEVRQLTDQDLRDESQKLDPNICKVLKDRQRIQRALMVYKATNRSIFDWQNDPKIKLPYSFKVTYFDFSGEILNQRINERFLKMTQTGALLEVEKLMNEYEEHQILRLPIARAIGFKEIYMHLSKLISKDEMIKLGQEKTRQYAKRQITWFKKQKDTFHNIILPSA